MLRLINETPFETNITLHGRIRLKVHPQHITKQLDQSPPIKEYLTEWIHILKNGPLYQQVDYCIDPWNSYEILMNGKGVTSLTMGFNDVLKDETENQHLGISIKSLRTWICLNDLEISVNPIES